MRSFTPFIVTFLFLIGLFSPALAQSDTVRLAEVTVASPFRADGTVPFSFQNLSRGQLQALNFGQEPAFILSQTPSVTVYSDAGSYLGYAYFRLRGIDQTRINVSLNGVPLNEPEDQGAYFSNYPDLLQSVQSVQIQRGVGTSKNGVASYAGSLQLESASLQEPRTATVQAGYGSFNSQRLFGELNTGVGNRHWGGYGRASVLRSDGYRERSGNASQSALVSVGYFGTRHLLKLTAFAGHQRNQLAWLGVPMDSLRRNPRTNANAPAETDQFAQAHLQLHHATQLKANVRWNNAVYYNYLRGNYTFDLNNFLGLPRTDELLNYALRSHWVGAMSNLAVVVNHAEIHAGIHANIYQRRHVGSDQTGELYRNVGYRRELSAFYKLNYAWRRFTLYADAQYRYSTFAYAGDAVMPTFHWHFLNLSGGATFALTDRARLYYSVGTTGREPTRNDLFQGNDNLPTDSTGAAQYLNIPPERVVNHELGIRLNHGRWFMHGNVYLMNFTNEIVLNGKVGPTGLPLRSNVASSYRSGLEVDARYRFASGVRVGGSASFSHNRIREGNVTFQPILTPAVLINPEVQWVGKVLRVALGGRYQSSSYLDFANQHVLPAFVTLDARATYRLPRLEFTLRVHNLTNQRYFTNGTVGEGNVPLYFVQAPANFFVSVAYHFLKTPERRN